MSHYPSLAALAIVFATGAAHAADLTIAVQDIPDSLDPAIENSNVNQRVMWSVFDTLITTDYRNGGQLTPGLAESWEVIDARTIEFELREGVVFHNGDSFDAEDVAFTFSPERLERETGQTVVTKPFLGNIDRVEVIDDHRVRIHMKEDDAIIALRFANYPSQIVSRQDFEEASSWEEFSRMPAGTGPYSFAEFEFGERVVIEVNDDYWGEAEAAAEQVTFVVTPEVSTRIAGLRAGQFDIITEVGPDSIPEIESAPNTSVVGGPVENIRGIVYDSTGNTLEDARIRQALNLAIDRQTLVDSLYQGRTTVPNGWQMDIYGDMYLEDRPMPAFDPEKARRLLEEAGYDGEPIIYRTHREYYTNEIETAQILQSMWAEVGLNVEIVVVENWAQVERDDAERQIINGSFTAYYPDPMGQFWRRFGPDGGWAQSDYYTISDEMQELGQTVATSTDTAERRAVFAEMLDRFEEDPDGGILHMLTQFMGVNERISMDPMPTLYMDLTTEGIRFNQ